MDRSKHNIDEKDFKTVPYEGVHTIWDAFCHQVRRIPDE